MLSTWRAAPSSVLNFTAQRRAKCAILWRGGLAGFVDILGHQLKYSEVVTFGILKYIWTFQVLAVYTLRKPVTNVL